MTAEERTKLAARIYKIFEEEFLFVRLTKESNEQLYTELLEQIEKVLKNV